MSPLAPCTPSLAEKPLLPSVSYTRVVTTAVAVLGTAMLPALLSASLAVEIQQDLSFGDAGLGLAMGAFWISAALASVPAGRIADALGGGTGVRLAGATVAASGLGIALAAHTYAVFVVCLALAGAGLALAAPGMSALVSRQMQVGRRGSALGFQQSGPPAASLVAGVALPVLGGTVGWRWSFAAAAVLAVGAAALVRQGDCRVVPKERGKPSRSTRTLALAGGLAAAAASAGITFLVPFTQAEGFSATQSGSLLAAAGLVTIATRVGLGFGADAGRVHPLREMTVLLAVGAGGFLLLASSVGAALAAGAMLGLGVGWGWGGLLVLTAIEESPAAPGTAVGAAMRGIYAGAVIGPLAGGLLAAGSPATLWICCAGLGAASAWIFSLQRHRLAREQAEL